MVEIQVIWVGMVWGWLKRWPKISECKFICNWLAHCEDSRSKMVSAGPGLDIQRKVEYLVMWRGLSVVFHCENSVLCEENLTCGTVEYHFFLLKN